MADDINEEIKEESCYDDCHHVEFKEVVGAKTLTDGGYFGSLLKLSRLHIDDSKRNGELTDKTAGEVYARSIEAAMAQSMQFGLQSAKTQIDIKLVDAQIKYQEHKISLEKDQFSLDSYMQYAKLALEDKKTHSDIDVNSAQIISMEVKDKQIFQQIKQSEQEIDQIKANMKKMECECENLIKSTNSKLDVDKAQIKKLDVDTTNETHATNSKILVDNAQINKLGVDIENETHATNSKILMDNSQINKTQVDIENETKAANSKILVDDSQINKMTVDNQTSVASTNSKIQLEDAQVAKLKADTENETKLNNSKIGLNNAQISKMICDCMNQGNISSAQASLYATQAKGFRDNARQKLFEAQMQGYAMVFEAADFESAGNDYIPDFFTRTQLQAGYNSVSSNLN